MHFLAFALLACRLSNYPVERFETAPVASAPTVEALAAPGPIELETLVAARWAVSNGGLIDLSDPKAAGIEEAKVPIVLMVHILRHPEKGDYIVDTGVAVDEDGGLAMLSGLAAKVIQPTDLVDLSEALSARGVSLRGAFLTHMHIDHILGLADLPPDMPIYIGPEEQQYRKKGNGLLRPTYRRALDGRQPLEELDFSAGVQMGGLDAIDFFGDGSLWVLHAPGHTPGSIVLLARTTEGPVLMLGDTSHTRWGWENSVPPGSFTLDREANKASIDALHALVDPIPGLRVLVGHEE